MSRLIKLLKLPNEPQTPGMRMMVEADVLAVTKLLNEYLADGRAKFHPIFDEAEVHHWFLPREDVVYSYVVETDGNVTDVLSFYTLPSTVIGNPKHSSLKAAYSFCEQHTWLFFGDDPWCPNLRFGRLVPAACLAFFNPDCVRQPLYVSADNVARTVTIEELMRDALILAIKHDFDVYNALDIFQNDSILKELKFGIGDGRLQYYIYNWRTAEVTAPEVGLVLL